MLHAHWRAEGFTVPNTTVYPWQWLWDSCFHALVWLELGEGDRAVTELATAFAHQDATGFVPHVTYHGAPGHLASFWERPRCSSITQPPIYGHSIAALLEAGVDVPASLVESAARGFRYLFAGRARHPSGLVAVVHPWETGCDDSPRFDHWGAADPARWYDVKGALVASVERGDEGEPIANAAFVCAPAGFNALLAWSARRLAGVTGDDWLRRSADEVADALADRYDADLGVWVDAGDADTTSGRTRTLDGLLPLLVHEVQVAAGPGWAGEFGPPGVHRDEPVYEPSRYWRGGVWPQLAYLLSRARAPLAAGVAAATVRGAEASGLAEYWHPDTGAGMGAIPQSWTGLALVMCDHSTSTASSGGPAG
jgi:glycogen debranching enzyme